MVKRMLCWKTWAWTDNENRETFRRKTAGNDPKTALSVFLLAEKRKYKPTKVLTYKNINE